MSVALLAISDGRHDYHERSLKSALRFLPQFEQYVFVDDPNHELGFAGAIERGWAQITTKWVFHLELDFTLDWPVDISGMMYLLTTHPVLAQIALKRQPVNAEEVAAGGIVELHPDDFEERERLGFVWTQHGRFFTTNPCFYRADLCQKGWPQEANSEGVFTHRLLEEERRFAFWGRKFERPKCTHIGDERTGSGY